MICHCLDSSAVLALMLLVVFVGALLVAFFMWR